jgi:hypothetical protein
MNIAKCKMKCKMQHAKCNMIPDRNQVLSGIKLNGRRSPEWIIVQDIFVLVKR